jgi:hypothetical protein
MSKDYDDDFLQYLMNQLHQAYSEYKRNNPEFVKAVEEQLKRINYEELKHNLVTSRKKPTHCQSCGEWLQNFDTCDQCGYINL